MVVNPLITLPPPRHDDDDRSLVTLVKPPDPALLDRLRSAGAQGRPTPSAPSSWEVDTTPAASPRLVGLIALRRTPPLDALEEHTAPFLLVARRPAPTATVATTAERPTTYAASLFHVFLITCATIALVLSWLGAVHLRSSSLF